MSKFDLKHLDALKGLSQSANSDHLKDSASELAESFQIIIDGLSMAGWNPDDEENLKDPIGRTAMAPPEGELELKADNFVKALEEDPQFSTQSFQVIKDFHLCRDSGKYHVAWCIAALLVAFAETVIPLAGGGK